MLNPDVTPDTEGWSQALGRVTSICYMDYGEDREIA